MSIKRVFVTVGTTKFDKLIESVSSEGVLSALEKLGYDNIHFQTGNSAIKKVNHERINISYTPYLDDFEEEIKQSDLIISHAGAGTCIEVLHLHKKLIVVINEDLMDNHQIELAHQLQSDRHLYYCTCDTLKDTLLRKNLNSLVPYPEANAEVFSSYLDKCMGFT